MKTSTYSNPHYCLSFGNDTVFLDIIVEISRASEIDRTCTMVIKQAQLDLSQEAFPAYLCGLLDGNALTKLQALIDEKLTEELTPSLFSLFYSGDIDQHATDTTAQ